MKSANIHLNHEPNQLLVSLVPSITFLSNLFTAVLTSLRVLLNSRSAWSFASSYFFLASTLYWSSFCSAFCASVLAEFACERQQCAQMRTSCQHTNCCADERTASYPSSPAFLSSLS
jgi:hypothetical protein